MRDKNNNVQSFSFISLQNIVLTFLKENYSIERGLSNSVVTWLLVISLTLGQPERAIVSSNSSFSISMTRLTPRSPFAARP